MLDQRLLEKYVNGLCSDEEKRLVESWLDEKDDIPELDASGDTRATGEEVWQHLKPMIVSETTKHNRLKPWAVISAAAVLLVCSLIAQLVNRVYRQDGRAAAEFSTTDGISTHRFEGLNFTLAEASSVAIKSGSTVQSAAIVFCGTVQITNQSNQDITYDFGSSCKESRYTRKEITFKAGKTYVAIHNYYKEDEIIVLRKDNLAGMPDAITAMVDPGFGAI